MFALNGRQGRSQLCRADDHTTRGSRLRLASSPNLTLNVGEMIMTWRSIILSLCLCWPTLAFAVGSPPEDATLWERFLFNLNKYPAMQFGVYLLGPFLLLFTIAFLIRLRRHLCRMHEIRSKESAQMAQIGLANKRQETSSHSSQFQAYRSPDDMRIRTYIPFLTVPTGLAWLAIKAHEVLTGRMNLPADAIGLGLWSVMTLMWLVLVSSFVVSGIVKLQHPYILTDERSIRVFGNTFNNRLSDEFVWKDIAAFQERTFSSLIVLMTDGSTKKIPLNGIGPWTMRQFVALIQSEAMKARANNTSDGIVANRAEPSR
jgi:hypothetical protein